MLKGSSACEISRRLNGEETEQIYSKHLSV